MKRLSPNLSLLFLLLALVPANQDSERLQAISSLDTHYHAENADLQQAPHVAYTSPDKNHTIDTDNPRPPPQYID